MPRERRFELPGLTLAAREWGGEDGVPVLALHGWLDNAGSFERLAPLLAGCSVIALDLAGHGRSDFRSRDSGYLLWQDVGDAIEVADRLGWSRFALMGHSRGAAIATLLAGAFPERVERLVLIEGGLPLIDSPEAAPARLADALTRKRGLTDRMGRVFPSRERAIDERAAGFSKVERETAEILARRSLREVPGGWVWHADQRLKAPSELRFTAEHVRAFVTRVSAPVLMFRATESPFNGSPEYDEIVPLFRSLRIVRLDGGHHLHLEGAEHAIAAEVRAFLGLA